jgi:hypothetical protein
MSLNSYKEHRVRETLETDANSIEEHHSRFQFLDYQHWFAKKEICKNPEVRMRASTFELE